MIINNRKPRPPLPDLVVKAEPSDWFVRPGDRVTFDAVVTNRGLAPAGPFHLKLDAASEGQDERPLEALAPGQTANVTLGPITIRHWVAGHNVTLLVDSDQQVEESNERNNRYELTLWDTSAPPFPHP